ncbi:uncharacterized protein LOC129943406 isoform X2 [Eupeodes corollae]|nr:uncharacterized protein LOC129940144 isoform X2 [Eupeodes corollae]XP_055908806.1 uncharacterized protein LOC129943406 isoform X2 [Eupeodes corollae]
MEQYPDLAKSFSANTINSRDSQRIQWEKLTRMLNENGPPTKSTAEWKRIWTIRKYNAKKKLIANKKSIAQTGGGPFTEKALDSVDEVIIQACGIEAAVEGTFGVSSFGCNEHELDNALKELLSEPVDVALEPQPTPTPASSSKRNKPPTKVEENTLLAEKQLELQQKFIDLQIKKLDDIDKTLQTVNNSIIELKDCVKLLCQEKQKERECSNALKKEELQLKRMELELAKAVNEIRVLELNKK